jgi:hypothetical protein
LNPIHVGGSDDDLVFSLREFRSEAPGGGAGGELEGAFVHTIFHFGNTVVVRRSAFDDELGLFGDPRRGSQDEQRRGRIWGKAEDAVVAVICDPEAAFSIYEGPDVGSMPRRVTAAKLLVKSGWPNTPSAAAPFGLVEALLKRRTRLLPESATHSESSGVIHAP